jgi:peptidoglycan/xylan/chitin deacetylase (PgdA/CDA1 family)
MESPARTTAPEDATQRDRGRGGGASPRALAINYHFLRPRGSGRFALRAHERPERFEQQLRQLAGGFGFARVADLLAQSPRADGPPRIALTFDDGARDVVRHGLPLLARHGATASVFVCSQPYLEGRLLAVQRIEFLMQKLGLERFRAAFYAELERQFPEGSPRGALDFAGGYRFYRYDSPPVREFKLDLNYRLPYDRAEPVLDALFRAAFGEDAEASAVRETYLSRDDLKRLVDAGCELGVHTHCHRVLPRLDLEEQRREIHTAAEFLREIAGPVDFALAYPFGFHDERTHKAAAELGLSVGLSMERRPVDAEDLRARWSLPRYDVNDCFDRESNQPRSEVFSHLESD